MRLVLALVSLLLTSGCAAILDTKQKDFKLRSDGSGAVDVALLPHSQHSLDTLAIRRRTKRSTDKVDVTNTVFVAQEVTSRYYHSCALNGAGEARCWGNNPAGQIGNGSVTAFFVQPQVVSGGFAFLHIRAGENHTCALRTNRMVYCWGANSLGQLGRGNNTGSSNIPVSVIGGLLFDSITVGANHTCGRSTNGFIYCWGSNSRGQLGDGTDIPIATLPVPIQGHPNLNAISSGGNHGCHIWTGGQLYCWGSDTYGQLGNGTAGTWIVPDDISQGSNYVAISAGNEHTCGLLLGGDAYCWGRGTEGQIGNNAKVNESAPTLVLGYHKFKAITAGISHTCALIANGAAYCWGRNNFGQLGVSTDIVEQLVPSTVAGGRFFTGISAGEYHTCGVTAAGEAYCWGWNSTGELGDGTRNQSPQPVRAQSTEALTAVSVGSDFSCALNSAGQAFCWGQNAAGQLGDGSYTMRFTPGPVSTALRFAKISAGNRYVCAITTTGAAYCWGANTYGTLGNGDLTVTSSRLPVAVLGGLSFSNISSGRQHACGLTVDRGEYCWGLDASGRLGDGISGGIRPFPVSIASGTYTWQSLGSGDNHTCAITTTDQLYCWGSNTRGQIGDASTTDRRIAVRITDPSTHIMKVAGGAAHTCAIRSDRSMLCWGDNAVGQLGDGTTIQRLIPNLVFGGIRFQELALGYGHSCGIRVSTHAYCWGRNSEGRLGNGTSVDSYIPVAAFFMTAALRSIAAGAEHTCAADGAGATYCWGSSWNGTLGNTFGVSYLPVPVLF
jgi:alpha-tubulin suppressor-like RCC1 family protein